MPTLRQITGGHLIIRSGPGPPRIHHGPYLGHREGAGGPFHLHPIYDESRAEASAFPTDHRSSEQSFFTLALIGAVASVYYRYRAEMDENEKGKPWTKSPR